MKTDEDIVLPFIGVAGIAFLLGFGTGGCAKEDEHKNRMFHQEQDHIRDKVEFGEGVMKACNKEVLDVQKRCKVWKN